MVRLRNARSNAKTLYFAIQHIYVFRVAPEVNSSYLHKKQSQTGFRMDAHRVLLTLYIMQIRLGDRPGAGPGSIPGRSI